MKTKEYQTGCVPTSQVEDGWLSNWLAERTVTGWTLKSTEIYFSKKHNEDCVFFVLERDVV